MSVTVTEYSAKSVVVRSNPPEYLRNNYDEYLKNAGGKYNPMLFADPNNRTGARIPGYIFTKTNEGNALQAAQNINSGQVPQQSPQQSSQGQSPISLLTPGAGQQANLPTQISHAGFQQAGQTSQQGQMTLPTKIQHAGFQQTGSQFTPTPQPVPKQPTAALPLGAQLTPTQPSTPTQQAQPSTPTRSSQPSTPTLVSTISPGLPGGAADGYQQIIIQVIKPEVGRPLQLVIGGQKIPVSVESVEYTGSVTTGAVISLPDGQRTKIQLDETIWQIPGFAQVHEISID